MTLKFCFFVLFSSLLHAQLNPVQSLTGQGTLYNYNNFWDGAVGGRGYWGRTPYYGLNVFSKNFDTQDYRKIYQLNSMAPFAQNLFPGFDSMVPYYTPNGASKYNFHPTNSNYLTNEQLGAFSYDLNDPRYTSLYKQYYDFFNQDLDRL